MRVVGLPSFLVVPSFVELNCVCRALIVFGMLLLLFGLDLELADRLMVAFRDLSLFFEGFWDLL